MVEIELTHGLRAIADDEDMDLLERFKWRALVRRTPGSPIYAVTRQMDETGDHFLTMHRLLLRAPDGVLVDHINRDGLDNRRGNLRLATVRENRRNSAPRRGHLFKGVTFHKQTGKWQAAIVDGQRTIHLGLFAAIEDAAAAYDTAAVRLFGSFARPNFAGGRAR